MPVFHIGLDDTDSDEGMCTTYLGAVIVDELKELGAYIVDYPRLVRLNPNWPMKTRGNCAVAITIEIEEDKKLLFKRKVLETVNSLAELDNEKTNPGVVFFESSNLPIALKEFSKKVINDVATIDQAEKLAFAIGAEFHKFKLGRGIIGALAAIGENFEEDNTFELIAYRISKNRGTIRKIDKKSVIEMDEYSYPRTFDNIDPKSNEIRITPHTPCPILYGIRSEDPVTAMVAHKMVKSFEPIERWMIYRTNQGTDAQYVDARIQEIRPYKSVKTEGIVASKPMKIPGGHVIFKLKDDEAEIYCAAYEPTRDFRGLVEKIIIGDLIKVYGGVKEKPELPLTINLEKFEIIKLATLIKKINPFCEKCKKRAKSAGKNKGFICKKCKKKFPEESIELIEKNRGIGVGIYEVPPRARRHLTKPLIRLVNSGTWPLSIDCCFQTNEL